MPVRGLAALLVVLLTAGAASARSYQVAIDSRKGEGLVPSFWRAATLDPSRTASPVSLKAIRIPVTLVNAAFVERIGGGGPGWRALDGAINAARQAGAYVILPIPVPTGDVSEDRFAERVADTVKRTEGRVSRYELLGDADTGVGDYLDLFEAAVWSAYQASPKASLGGPGVPWQAGWIHSLVNRCAERRLPLHFLSWTIYPQKPDEPERSFRSVARLVDASPLERHPLFIVTGWGLLDTTADPVWMTCSAMLSLLATDVEAACSDVARSPWVEPAMLAFERLGHVRVPLTVSPGDGGLDGIAALDGDDLVMLFWNRGESGTVDAVISLSGMRWGRSYRVDREQISNGGTQQVDTQTMRAADPLELRVPVPPGRVTVLSVSPE